MSRFIKSPDGKILINLNLVEQVMKANETCSLPNRYCIDFSFRQGLTRIVYNSEFQRDHVFNSIDDNGTQN